MTPSTVLCPEPWVSLSQVQSSSLSSTYSLSLVPTLPSNQEGSHLEPSDPSPVLGTGLSAEINSCLLLRIPPPQPTISSGLGGTVLLGCPLSVPLCRKHIAEDPTIPAAAPFPGFFCLNYSESSLNPESLPPSQQKCP